jgi:hypothetical protein
MTTHGRKARSLRAATPTTKDRAVAVLLYETFDFARAWGDLPVGVRADWTKCAEELLPKPNALLQ